MSGNVDKSKEWQLELLMEKLRSKAGQFKSFPEMSKNVRMAMLDKRYALDSVEKAQHQKCLDTLQHCIKVTSFQSMVERLESLTRQLGLKFMAGPSGVELFISSDMFYLEVILEPNERGGGVRDVKIHHEGKNEQQSCAELVHCLSRQDFADFTLQLEGLASIYQLNAEKKVKSKAFSALQALETDLNTLAQLQTNKDPFYLVHKSSVGILEKRRGGHPMKLTYLVSPYELIDSAARGRIEPLTVERVVSRKLGYSATVCIEGSTAHKLPIQPIVSVNRSLNSSNGTPSYAPLTGQNSATIPACFTLRLSKQMCVCTVLAKRIQNITQLECGDLSASHPLLSLITQHASDGQLDCANNRGLFVTLPDQQHCYFLTEGRSLQGVVINSVPFTSPKYVPSILALLRQQALFNTILSSCIRPNSKQDFENMIMFEINALSWQHLSISLEHPIEESMATADIDLTDISNITCKVYGPNNASGEPSEVISDIATKVLQRCLSIPVTMRAIIKAWENMHESKKYINGNENFSLPLGSDDPGGHKNSNDSPLADYGNLESKMKSEHSVNNGNSNMSNSSHQTTFINDPLGFTNFSNAPGNLDANFNPTVTATTTSEKHYKKHKRKNKDDNWKSPKRKQGEDVDIYVAESSSSSDSVSTPLSQEATSDLVVSTPPSTLGFQSDFDLSGLDASELISNEKNALDFDCSNDNDLEDILSSNSRSDSKPKKSKENRKSPMEVGDDTDKQQVPPSVSITPITTTPSTKYNFMLTEIERRPGIEIIPITSTSNTSLPSSITITPITSTQSTKSTEERNRERKVSKTKSDDKTKLEKKRKRKREEDGMNPPDKITVKQDPLTKPVSVSIKPTEILSLPASPSTKHSPSPSRSLSSSKQGSPSSKHSASKTSNSLHHPGKNLSIGSSTKQSSPGVSPKHPSASPKHSSTTSGTGKPSMSTLKSATSVPVSNKSSDSSRTKPSKDPLKEKDKKTSSTSSLSGNSNNNSPTSSNSYSSTNKIKTSSVKLKQLNLSCSQDSSNQSENLASPTSVDLNKASLQSQARNRKGSLSAIVDNLHKKSAQHCPESESGNSNKTGNNRSNLQSPKLDANKTMSKNSEAKNSEYMVKPSSDGMKITINKTRSKEAKSMSQNISSVSSNALNVSNNPNIKLSQSNTGNNSPKTHTGLKPGVNSGPASKKPQQLNQKTSNINTSCSSPTAKNLVSSTKTSSMSRTNSASLLASSKATNKLNNALERSRDNKIRSSFGKGDKSFNASRSSELRRSSPTIAGSRDEIDGERGLKLHSKSDQPFPSHIMVEGLIKQTLDTKFQIPKLSSKNNITAGGDNDNKKSIKSINQHTESSSIVNNTNSSKCDSPRNESTIHNLSIFSNINNTDDKTKAIMDVSTTNTIVPTTSSLRLPSFAADSHLQIANLTKTVQSSPNHILDDSKLKKELLAITHVESNDDNSSKLKSKFPVPTSLPYSTANETLNLSLNAQETALSGKQSSHAELAMKVVTTTSQEVVEMLLDFSTSNPESISKLKSEHSLQSILPTVHHRSTSLPASPSVSVHIMKSPAPSPLIVPSPHSAASSCITDDDLMDEALVGIGK